MFVPIVGLKFLQNLVKVGRTSQKLKKLGKKWENLVNGCRHSEQMPLCKVQIWLCWKSDSKINYSLLPHANSTKFLLDII